MYRPAVMPKQIDQQLLLLCEPQPELALDAFIILLKYALPLVSQAQRLISVHTENTVESKLLSSFILACKGPLNSLFKQLCVLRKYEASPRGLWLKIREQYIQDKGVELSIKQLHQQSLNLEEVQANIEAFSDFFPTELQGYVKQIYLAFLSNPFFLEQDKELLKEGQAQLSYLEQSYLLYQSTTALDFWDQVALNQLGLIEKTTVSDLLICILGLREGKLGAVHLLFQSLLQKAQPKSIKITQAETALTSILQHPQFTKLQQMIKAKAEANQQALALKKQGEQTEHQGLSEEAQSEKNKSDKLDGSDEKKEAYKIIRHFTPKYPNPNQEQQQQKQQALQQALLQANQKLKQNNQSAMITKDSLQADAKAHVKNHTHVDLDNLDFATHLTSPIDKLDLSIAPQHTPLPDQGENIGKRHWRIEERLSGFSAHLKDDPLIQEQLEESRTWKVRFRRGSVYENGALKWSKADWSIYHSHQKPIWLEDQLNQQGNLLKLLQLNQLNLPTEWGWDEDSNRYYVISPLLSGPNLKNYLSKEPIESKKIIELFLPILKALSTLHLMGISHGNIKLNNLVFHDKTLFLTDFHLISALFPGGSKLQRDRYLQECAPELKLCYEKAIEQRNQGKSIELPYHFSSVPADLFALGKLFKSLLSQDQSIDHLSMDIQLVIKELMNSKPENRISLQEAIYLLDPSSKPANTQNQLQTVATHDLEVDQPLEATSFMPLLKELHEFQWDATPLSRFRLLIGHEFIDFIFVKPEQQPGFLMSTTAVTQAIWQQLMQSHPSIFNQPSFPIDSVSYDDCIAFCQRLNHYISQQEALKGLKIITDLPKLEQWKYCANAGQRLPYAGSAYLDEVGWYVDNAKGSLQGVGLKKANAWGFYDLSGNVWEWIKNEEADALEALAVGGSWLDVASQCQIGNTRKLSTQFSALDQGFRICLRSIALA